MGNNLMGLLCLAIVLAVGGNVVINPLCDPGGGDVAVHPLRDPGGVNTAIQPLYQPGGLKAA